MTIWLLRFINKLIKILNSGDTPSQIAGGVTVGFLIGATPFNPITALLLFFILSLLNVNFTSGLFAILITSLIAPLFDSIFHTIGYFFLVDLTSLESFWTILYNSPIFPVTHFNNTIVLGSTILSFILAIFIYFGSKSAVHKYRSSYKSKLENSKLFKLLKTSRFAQWYSKVAV